MNEHSASTNSFHLEKSYRSTLWIKKSTNRITSYIISSQRDVEAAYFRLFFYYLNFRKLNNNRLGQLPDGLFMRMRHMQRLWVKGSFPGPMVWSPQPSHCHGTWCFSFIPLSASQNLPSIKLRFSPRKPSFISVKTLFSICTTFFF